MKILTLSANGAYFDNASVVVNDTDNTITCEFDMESTVSKVQVKKAFGGDDVANLYRLTLNSAEADSDDDCEEFVGYTRVVSIEVVDGEEDGTKHCTVVLRRPNLNELIEDVYTKLEMIASETENVMMAAGGSFMELNSDLLTIAITELGGK